MNRLDIATRVSILSALVEGVGINATSRMTGVSNNTVLKLLRDIGPACDRYHNEHVRNLKTRRVQADEVWSFVYAKAKNVPQEKRGFGIGDVWTWTAIDADSKLLISYLAGLRDAGYAFHFMQDVASRLANRVQLTTDGYKVYLDAVEDTFGTEIDYAQLVKIYGTEQLVGETRYSPPKCLGARSTVINGSPDEQHINTSYVERANLTLRLMNRRFTRLTLGFSKKIENHVHALALYAFHYNFCKIHKTLRCTPAMEAGVTGKLWEISDIVNLIELRKQLCNSKAI
jgi:IS1 family transposase